jgi:hypothetical protein
MFLQHYVTFPFFPTQISGGPRNRQYHQLSLGQAPHDAKGIHHLQQINPGRSLVGICYIPAVGKGLRTYRFRRPSPGIVVYPEMGLIPARAPPLTSSGSSRQCYHLLPLQPFRTAPTKMGCWGLLKTTESLESPLHRICHMSFIAQVCLD